MSKALRDWRYWLVALSTLTLFFWVADVESRILPEPLRQECEQGNQTDKKYCPAYRVFFFFVGEGIGCAQKYNGLLTAIATGFIAAFTIVLAGVGKRQATLNKLVADNAIVSQRAYVTLSHNAPGLRFDRQENGDFRYDVNLAVINSGRTPGRVTGVRLWPIIADNLPPSPDYNGGHTLDSAMAFLVPNDRFSALEPLGTIPAATHEAVRAGNLKIFVYGFVDYMDVFRGRYRGGYARVFDPGRDVGDINARNNLVFVTQPQYSYDRPRSPDEGDDWAQENA